MSETPFEFVMILGKPTASTIASLRIVTNRNFSDTIVQLDVGKQHTKEHLAKVNPGLRYYIERFLASGNDIVGLRTIEFLHNEVHLYLDELLRWRLPIIVKHIIRMFEAIYRDHPRHVFLVKDQLGEDLVAAIREVIDELVVVQNAEELNQQLLRKKLQV